MKAELLFGTWPYLAGALFVVGSLIRFVLMRKGARANHRDLPKVPPATSGNAAWRCGVLVLLLGHLAGLLLPGQILAWNSVPLRLYVLEGIAFAAGASALAGWAGIFWRRVWRSAGQAATQLADVCFFSLLFTNLVSGLLTAIAYRWASSWGATTLAPYFSSILKALPATALPGRLPFLVQLHVFSAFVLLAVFPFTSAFLLVAAVASRAIAPIFRQARAIATGGRAALEGAVRRLDPAAWIWPEEE